MFQISCSRAQPCSPPQPLSPGCPQALGTQAVPPSPQMSLLEAKAAAQRDPAPGHHKPRVGSEVAALLCFGPPPNCAISNCGVSEHSDCRKSRVLVYVSEAVRVTFLFWHRGAPAPALTSPGAAPRGCSCSCSFLADFTCASHLNSQIPELSLLPWDCACPARGAGDGSGAEAPPCWGSQ